MTLSGIAFIDVAKRFGARVAVHHVSFSVPDGAFFALVGPSGCGKTTLLRLIAGLERPSEGRIEIGGKVVAEKHRFVPPEERGLGMVFQNYALWPHMTVGQNVAFGLATRGLGRAEREARVDEALTLVGLADQARRRPHELSGGQRQRVALARSLAVRPRLILLDEPLANLDAHLRQTMLAEFRRIHRQSGTTFVFVTHDQNEAMALADLVAVMDQGRIAQIAPPPDLFARPATPMVARFIGQGRTLPVEVLEGPNAAGRCVIALEEHRFTVPGEAPPGPGWLCLRARDLRLAADGEPALRLPVADQRFEAGDHVLTLAIGANSLEIIRDRPAEPGEMVRITPRGGWVLPRQAA